MTNDSANSDLLSSSFDDKLKKYIKEIQDSNTSVPEDLEYDVKPLVGIIKYIMTRANTLSENTTNVANDAEDTKTRANTLSENTTNVANDAEDTKTRANTSNTTNLGASSHDDLDKYDKYKVEQIAKSLETPINHISYVMTWKCVGEIDSHAITMKLLRSVIPVSCAWDVKAVITWAAFAINYGDFSLLTQSFDKTIATLMGFADQSSKNQSSQPKHSKDVRNLLTTALELTHCAVDFKDFPSKYTVEPDEIPPTVYLIIRTLVICASLLTDILCGHNTIAREVKDMLSTLQSNLSLKLVGWQETLKKAGDKKKDDDMYKEFKKIISDPQSDNMEAIDAFFVPRKDKRPLYNGTRLTNERLDVLRQKLVLLLISDLDLPPEELIVLHLIHNVHAMMNDYKILWLPVTDPNIPLNEMDHAKFIGIRSSMPWYSAEHPSAIEHVLIKYIKEELHFTHMPMLVVLDPGGKLSHHDALPMMWIWGFNAFPFTLEREQSLWNGAKWNIDLIADSIDPRIPDWMDKNRVICLYGGDDINWVRNFTKSAKKAARALNVQLEMLYVGKRNPKEKVRNCHEVIAREDLSNIFARDYYDYVWYFWVRLASMWNSKKQIKRTVEDDPIMQGILDLLTYDSSEQGWAIFSRGINETAMASGDKLVPVLDDHITWGKEVDHPDKFVPVLDKILRGFHQEHHCHVLILPAQAGYILERVDCTECGKTMDMYAMYRCCTD